MPRDYETPEYLRRLPAAEHGAIEVELLMSEPEVAREVLRQLLDAQPHNEQMALLRERDAVLHPWGELGEVPDEDGDYYVVQGDEEEVHTAFIETMDWGRAVTLDSWGETLPVDDELVLEHRFRKRWTPETPA